MVDTQTQQKSALSSLTIRGALVMAVAFAAARAGVVVPDGTIAQLVDSAINLIFAGGALAVGVGRARAKGPLR